MGEGELDKTKRIHIVSCLLRRYFHGRKIGHQGGVNQLANSCSSIEKRDSVSVSDCLLILGIVSSWGLSRVVPWEETTK